MVVDMCSHYTLPDGQVHVFTNEKVIIAFT